MIICVTHENGNVGGHFGHAKELKVYEVKKGQVVNSKVLTVNGQGHEFMLNILLELNADCLITNGCGAHAIQALTEKKILICKGVEGNCDQAVEDFLNGDLEIMTPEGVLYSDEEDDDCGSCGGCCGNCGGCGGCC